MLRTVIALLPVAALVALLAASSASSDPPPDAAGAAAAPVPAGATQGVRREKGRKLRIKGRLGFGRAYRRKQALPRALRRKLDQSFAKVNPSDPEGPPPRPASTPARPVTADLAGDPPLDARRRSDSPKGVAAPDPRTARPGHPSARRARRTEPQARAAAANDFELWRSQPVAQGAGITGTVAEPTVANDRNGLLFTGNWHAATSGDNGLTWQYLNPATQFASIKGGFCCDQVAYAVDRGSYSLIFWLLQYRDDGVTGGALRLVVYQGRSELLSQAAYCEHVITPATINESGAKWFDFNVMSSTDERLYISSKVIDSATGAHVTGAVMRWDLDDFDDGNCTLNSGWVYKNADGSKQNTALAQGAGSTMYWGKRTANGTLDIWSLPDSSHIATRYTRNVSTWPSSGRGASHCPVPDGTDPCARANDKLNVAFVHDGKVGFAWNAAEGSGFPFPHIRMARFDLPNMTLVDEPHIWNRDYAWAYAAAGVSAAGHLGLSLYRIGGGSYPRARVALVDDVDTSIHSLNMHGIITSDAGTLDPTGAVIGRWGDYAAVRPYGNCANTFAGAVHSQQGGNLNQNSEHRFIWFGRERDGCADLVVSALESLPAELERGDDLYIGQTTRNTGSGRSDASTTRFYLSRDTAKSGDDVLLGATAAHGAMAPGESEGLLTVAEVPSSAAGTYYLIACADDERDVAELTDTNNCRAGDTVTVNLSISAESLQSVTSPQWGGFVPGRRFSATLRVRRPPAGRARRGGRAWAGLWLSRSSRRTAKATRVAAKRLADPPGRRARTRRHRLRGRIPAHLAPGDYRVMACVARSRRRPSASRCLIAEHVLHVAPRPSKRSRKDA